MTAAPNSSAAALIQQIRNKAPEYLDLLTATNDEQFEQAFDSLLGPAVARLEENKKLFKGLREEGLTAALAMSLSIPGLAVSQEKNSNGHVDLVIQADHSTTVRKKLLEAKIYKGPKYHISGLQQLLERYTTGREGDGLLVAYFKKRNIASLVPKLRRRMDSTRPCKQQGPASDHVHKWSFRSKHSHTSGEQVQVSHIGCNLF
jgi:hypothetical protein